MSHLLNHLDRIAENIGNPARCTYRKMYEDEDYNYEEEDLTETFALFKQSLNIIIVNNKSPERVKEHINAYQNRIKETLDKLHDYRSPNCKFFSLCRRQILELEKNFLVNFLDLLETSFPNYFDLSLSVPKVLCRLYVKRIEEVLEKIPIHICNTNIVNDICKIVREIIIEQKSNISLRIIRYLEHFVVRFVQELKVINFDDKELFETCTSFLIRYDFNDIRVYNYLTGLFVCRQEGVENISKKCSDLSFLRKVVEQVIVVEEGVFRKDFQSLRDMLINWVDTEIKFYNNFRPTEERKIVSDGLIGTSYTFECQPKIKTNFSVEQLACLISCIIETNMVCGKRKMEIFRFFAKCFETKNSSNLSAKSLSNNSYIFSDNTKKTIKDMLLKIIKYLNN